MSDLSWEKLKQLVYERAYGCCEYCQICEENSSQIMPVDYANLNFRKRRAGDRHS